MLRRIDTTPVPSRGSLTTVLEQLEEQIRAFRRIDQQQLAASGLALAKRRPRSAAEKNMLFSWTARRRPSLTSSGAVNSISARALAMIS